MTSTHFLKARVTAETKHRVRQAAARDLITESVWLKRVVMTGLKWETASADTSTESILQNAQTRGARLYVRLRPEDRLLLHERATARGLRPATYVSVLTRAHLRQLAPLPKEELQALKRAVSEIGVIGRNLNQLARIANQTGKVIAPGRDEVTALLKVCAALRDHTKALIKANVDSWEIGHDETNG